VISAYNALQATVKKRFQGGGTMLVSYTNAKLMSNTDTLTSWLEGGTTGGVGGIQDWNNLKGERSLSSQDVSQRLVVSYVLDLPFGHGQKYFGGVNGVAGAAVSGWGLDGVTTLQRGFPVKLNWGGSNAFTAAGLGIGALRPDYISGCDKSISGSSVDRVGEWFNTACFTAPSGLNSAGVQNNPWTPYSVRAKVCFLKQCHRLLGRGSESRRVSQDIGGLETFSDGTHSRPALILPNIPDLLRLGLQVLEKNGGDDGTRTRALCRDRAAF
jgi:hypothetical protein